MNWPPPSDAIVFDVYSGPEGDHWVVSEDAYLDATQIPVGSRVSIIGVGQYVVTRYGWLTPVEHPLPVNEHGYPQVWS